MSHATVTSLVKSISLYFTDGRSDKEYHAQIEEAGPEQFVVAFRFGRRGSSLQGGVKTPQPVSLAEAEKIFKKLVAEKTAKGYTPGESGAPYQGTALEEENSGIVSQLLNPLEESQIPALLDDASLIMQEKVDGQRRLIKRSGGKVIGINKKGLVVPLPEALTHYPDYVENFLMDGEIVGDTFFAFDLLELFNESLREKGCEERIEKLRHLVGRLDKPSIVALNTYRRTDEKINHFREVKLRGGEGVVFKDKFAPYSPGRPNSNGSWLKFKFTKTASVFVREVNSNRRSVLMAVFEGKRIVEIGNVTIPVNHTVPWKDEVIEVRYLYANPGGALYQPQYLGKRNDVERSECKISQIAFKSNANESDE